MESVSSLDSRSAGIRTPERGTGESLPPKVFVPPGEYNLSDSESWPTTVSTKAEKQPRYLSSPEVLSRLPPAPDGRNDGSSYGAATVWNPFGKIHVHEPTYEEFYEGETALTKHYDEFLKRLERKKNTIAGLNELIRWTESELEYNERKAEEYHRKHVVPAELKLREKEFDDTERQYFSEILMHDWDHRNNVRKTKEEIRLLDEKRSFLEEQEIARDYLVTKTEEDEWFGCVDRSKKVKI